MRRSERHGGHNFSLALMSSGGRTMNLSGKMIAPYGDEGIYLAGAVYNISLV
jgi:hypothetical protein